MYLPLPSHPRGVCVSTLRGHADSVNAVYFLPYTNTLVTASADKTLSLWDTRTVGTPPPPPLHTPYITVGTVCADILWPSQLM